MKLLKLKQPDISKRWGFFEYTLLALILLALGSVAYIIIPRNGYATVTIRVGNRELLYNNEGSLPVVDTTQFVPGLEGKDAFGKVEAKILSVDSYPHPKDTLYGRIQTVFVTTKVSAVYNAKRGTYKYKGTTMQMGDWMRIDIGPVTVEGVITDINGQFAKAKPETLRVKAQLKTEDPRIGSEFTSTTGVDPFIANAITVGDTMTDANGTVIATIVDKKTTPARTVVTDLYGHIFEQPNPRKIDVYLVVDLTVRKIEGALYFLSEEPVKVNGRLPLFLHAIDIEPRITEIVSK